MEGPRVKIGEQRKGSPGCAFNDLMNIRQEKLQSDHVYNRVVAAISIELRENKKE